jgi:hypothetical protein
MEDIKHIDIREFREAGYLHEVNRLFFHPLGLALEVAQEDDGSEHLGGVWDYREDAEGIYFSRDYISREKIESIQRIVDARRPVRESKLGFWIQEPGDVVP